MATPFRFTWNPQGDVEPTADAVEGNSGLRHPICKVLEWEQRLQSENSLTRAQLAREEGFTKAYVTQMLRLLNLPEEARQYLADLRSPEIIRSFSLRRLGMVAKLPSTCRAQAFDAMKVISSRSGC
ncbi:MAG: ParB/RepB/Spo0J family partition protein [Luteolibacter sp.]